VLGQDLHIGIFEPTTGLVTSFCRHGIVQEPFEVSWMHAVPVLVLPRGTAASAVFRSFLKKSLMRNGHFNAMVLKMNNYANYWLKSSLIKNCKITITEFLQDLLPNIMELLRLCARLSPRIFSLSLNIPCCVQEGICGQTCLPGRQTPAWMRQKSITHWSLDIQIFNCDINKCTTCKRWFIKFIGYTYFDNPRLAKN